MKFYKSITILFFLFSFYVNCQNSEIGLIAGSSYYIGELNTSVQVINKVRPSVGLFYRKNLSKRYALRFGANYAMLSATDKLSSTELSQFRQLSFSTNLLEGYGILEFNFIPYQINNYATSRFTPYVFIGVAGFWVRPRVDGGGDREVAKADVIAPSIPFGLGVKFNFLRNLGLGIEWGMRKTFTDQIDGLSEKYVSGYQLSNTQNNDWYSIIGITLNYKILTKSDHCPGVIN
jgi:hypothetical protein